MQNRVLSYNAYLVSTDIRGSVQLFSCHNDSIHKTNDEERTALALVYFRLYVIVDHFVVVLLRDILPQVTSDNFNVEYAPSLSCVNHVQSGP